ncbi:BQ5605_C019g08941 [Microbotryum silenes-dioicae]|uniref:BQ5605_C019g08941 protein n=1 Tax=Microbotryum silenes-dioicae TaxID=796604 RepID=A0A2X0MR16_9BASI|nr:BQ5605_C019g08941 [Microbotryum silenes-dioicae]
MALLTSLPVELIIEILSRLGWHTAHYSDRERQSDLTSVALVSRPCMFYYSTHPAFLHAAQYLLYSSPSLTIRNSGRSASLASTVSSKPELASLITSLVAFSDKDVGHPASVTTILNSCLNVSSLSLGVAIFNTSEASNALKLAALQKNLTRFTWVGIDLYPVADLLAAWTNLRDLNVTVETSKGLEIIAIPRYHLQILSVSGRPTHGMLVLGGDYLVHLLGSTRPGTLRVLELHHICFESSDDTASTVLNPYLPFVRSLTMRHLIPNPLLDWLSVCEPHTSLRRLVYSPTAGTTLETFGNPLPIPKSLRSIHVTGRTTYLEMGLIPTLQSLGVEDHALRLIELRGPFASDPRSAVLRTLCTVQGIELQVRREFSGLSD